ncbi:MAG: hypothetical protein MJ236_02845 [Clostridia bacterium]|nr:hypothetical protein [Clostridia bacterium]
MKKANLSAVSTFHYFRLAYRSILFLIVLIRCIQVRISGTNFLIKNLVTENNEIMFWIVWGIFMFEMVLRFFPSSFESPGCQKQFSKNYTPTGKTDVQLHDNNAAFIVALIWVVFNIIFGALHMTGIIDDGIMLLLCLAFSVCDMICILFFCPFQTLFLKNKCCCTCRIYNWDYAMMFTPLFFIRSVYTWTLVAAAICILVRWEITIWRYPERFSDNTNQYLACKNCSERLCSHKKQLMSLREHLAQYAIKTINRILKK